MRIPLNMGDNSKIEWTEATWNPVTGCSKVSAGCKNCYAQERGSSPREKKDCGWAACLIGWSMDADMKDDPNASIDANDVRRLLLKEIVNANPPRSVFLRGWCAYRQWSTGVTSADLYSILAYTLATGPAIVVWGTLDDEGRPNDARVDYGQKEWHSLDLDESEREALIDYARRWIGQVRDGDAGTNGAGYRSAVRRLQGEQP